jgi:hypothetical protein
VSEPLVIPPTRELPPGRSEELRRNLLEEIAGPARRRGLRGSRRTYAAAGAILAAVAVAAPTLAVSSRMRELVGLSASRPLLVRVPLKLSAPVENGERLGLFVTPAGQSGECWFVSLSRAEASPRAVRGTGLHARLWVRPRACQALGGSVHTTERTAPLDVEARPACGFRARTIACVYGWVSPTVHAERVELQWRGGAERLSLGDGYFIGAAPVLADPRPEDAPFAVVAYDAGGHEVARQEVDVRGA